MKRFQQLDFLRGVAILLVLFTHFKIIDMLYQIGWIGVDLFFVLSGFLVSGLLFQEYKKHQNIKIGRFLIRRGFKIYPMFYLFILVSILLGKFFDLATYDLNAEYFGGISRRSVLAEVLFIQNYLGGIWINTWSLGVEEHFYFGIALLFLLLAKFKLLHKHQVIIPIMLSILTICLALRIYTNASHETFYYITHLFPTHLRADSLMFGVLISFLYHFKYKWFHHFIKTNRTAIMILGSLCLVPTFGFNIRSFFMNTFGLTLIYIGFGCWLSILIVFENSGKHLKKFPGKYLYHFICRVGIYSYSIYIWHLLVKHYSLFIVKEYFPHLNAVLYFLIYFFLSLGIGAGLSKLVEIPLLRLRDKLVPRRV